MKKIIRAIYNISRIIIIRIRCGKKVVIPIIQPMRIDSQLLIQAHNSGVKIGKNCRMESGSRIRVIDKGKLIIGDNCFFNCGSYLTALGEIEIGNGCLFGPGVMIFDHDHDYKSSGGVADGNSIIGKITIGNNVWVGANCVILRGANIGANSVIAAGTVVKGKIPSNSLVYQKRIDIIKKIEHNL